jgi:hypothetical protein
MWCESRHLLQVRQTLARRLQYAIVVWFVTRKGSEVFQEGLNNKWAKWNLGTYRR